MPTKRQIVLTQDDVLAIRETAKVVGRLTVIVEAMQELTKGNTDTISGNDGLSVRLARVEEMMKALSEIPTAMRMISEAYVNAKYEITDVQDDIKSLQSTTDRLVKDVSDLWEVQKKSPSITWLVQNRLKQIALITIGMVGFTTITISLLVFPELDRLWESVLKTLLRYLGI
jgi:methyl-accepting chemotaxis protein